MSPSQVQVCLPRAVCAKAEGDVCTDQRCHIWRLIRTRNCEDLANSMTTLRKPCQFCEHPMDVWKGTVSHVFNGLNFVAVLFFWKGMLHTRLDPGPAGSRTRYTVLRPTVKYFAHFLCPPMLRCYPGGVNTNGASYECRLDSGVPSVPTHKDNLL